MPEGHLLHRFAWEQTADLAGEELTVSSPQGRFDPAPVDGRRLDTVEAYGKQLLYRFDGPTVRVHLGMRGIFLRYDDPAAEPRKGARMRLAGSRAAYDLIAPSRCEVLDDATVAALLAGLGPDPLRPDARDDDAVRRLRAYRGAIGAALLDQAVWAGIGNAWRAELLYLARLDPRRAAKELDEESARELWQLTRRLLALGRDAGQVVSDPAAPNERWVYKRATCRGCGAPVREWPLGGRAAYACEAEQLS